MRSLFILLLLLSASGTALAQDTISNGGFNVWHGGFFAPGPHGGEGCCGAALAVPESWGTPEQLMAMPTNQFVFKEDDTAYIHSGAFSARLLTDITTRDSAGDLASGLAVLLPGSVTCAGIVGYGSLGLTGDLYQNIAYSKGLPFVSRPTALRFYMMIEHDEPDTMHYAYVFSRWDSVAHVEDTIAYQSADIADAGMAPDRWVLFTDTIQYSLTGLPDTLHLIFYGGRNADSTKAGNITWLDDVSFYYAGGVNDTTTTPTGIVHLSMDDAVSVYPNPASGQISVRLDDYMTGYTIELYDLMGRSMIRQALNASLTSFSVSSLTDGVYLYRMLDSSGAEIRSGRVTIEK